MPTVKAKILMVVCDQPGLTQVQIAARVFPDNPRTQRVHSGLSDLLDRGIIWREGDPFRYYLRGHDGAGLGLTPVARSPKKPKSPTALAAATKSCESTKSLLRKKKRHSPTIVDFRERIEDFLKEVKAEQDIIYSIKRDLSTMTSMEFYGRPKQRVRCRSDKDTILQYIGLLKEYNDFDFSEKLLKKLSVQQNQVLRRLVPRRGSPTPGKKGNWDHAVPTAVVVREIIAMLQKRRFTHLEKLLELYICGGQVHLTHEENQRLNSLGLNNRMPESWNWREKKPNPFERYVVAGIDYKGRIL